MTIHCTEEFKSQVENLEKSRAYRSIREDVSEYFHGKAISEVSSGTRLNNSDATPYIKKRINGSGGFRLYFLILIQEENIYLMFIHPKTGPEGAENISDEAKARIYKDVLAAIQSHTLYNVDTNDGTLKFAKIVSSVPKIK